MGVGVHRKAQAECVAQLSQMLHLLNPSPVVRIAKNYLDGICANTRRKIAERRNCDIAGERRSDSSVEQFSPHSCHSGNGCGGVLQVSAIPKLFSQCFANT